MPICASQFCGPLKWIWNTPEQHQLRAVACRWLSRWAMAMRLVLQVVGQISRIIGSTAPPLGAGLVGGGMPPPPSSSVLGAWVVATSVVGGLRRRRFRALRSLGRGGLGAGRLGGGRGLGGRRRLGGRNGRGRGLGGRRGEGGAERQAHDRARVDRRVGRDLVVVEQVVDRDVDGRGRSPTQ